MNANELDPVFVSELTMDRGGVWAVRSASETVYFLDLERMELLRHPGDESTTGPFDSEWVALIAIEAVGEEGIVRVGRRHRYLTDPDPRSRDFRWWLQRVVTQIDEVPKDQRPVGRDSTGSEFRQG